MKSDEKILSDVNLPNIFSSAVKMHKMKNEDIKKLILDDEWMAFEGHSHFFQLALNKKNFLRYFT